MEGLIVMQYLLTEDEYLDLTTKHSQNLRLQQKELQELCSKIADEMPIQRDWDANNHKPWGCILTAKYEWYCDKCPVQKICPNPYKEWSK